MLIIPQDAGNDHFFLFEITRLFADLNSVIVLELSFTNYTGLRSFCPLDTERVGSLGVNGLPLNISLLFKGTDSQSYAVIGFAFTSIVLVTIKIDDFFLKTEANACKTSNLPSSIEAKLIAFLITLHQLSAL
jgi:hypothetical protein